jgi:hypothetical protein
MVDLMVKLAPEVYRPYVVSEGGKGVLYLQVLMVLYGMLVVALLWYKKFKEDLEKIDFKYNPFDACVANCSVRGGQQTVRFHINDLMSRHKDASGWMGCMGNMVLSRLSEERYMCTLECNLIFK